MVLGYIEQTFTYRKFEGGMDIEEQFIKKDRYEFEFSSDNRNLHGK